MYLGEARFYPERMGEFIKVAKDLEVKEISDGVDMQNKEEKTFDVDDDEIIGDNDVEQSVKEENQIKVEETKIRQTRSQIPSDYQATTQSPLQAHIQTEHGGCDDKIDTEARMVKSDSVRSVFSDDYIDEQEIEHLPRDSPDILTEGNDKKMGAEYVDLTAGLSETAGTSRVVSERQFTPEKSQKETEKKPRGAGGDRKNQKSKKKTRNSNAGLAWFYTEGLREIRERQRNKCHEKQCHYQASHRSDLQEHFQAKHRY